MRDVAAVSFRALCAGVLVLWLAVAVGAQHSVVATTPDLAALCRAVGGEAVTVTALARGAENPHFLDARPSLVRSCSRAEALVETGRELEIGWLPVLVTGPDGAV